MPTVLAVITATAEAEVTKAADIPTDEAIEDTDEDQR